MREIKFRGKRVVNGEWVYGYYEETVNNGNHFYWINVLNGDFNDVIPETVGQYTGLKDKNGVEIYEGDIVTSGHLVTYSTGRGRWFSDVGVVRHDTRNGCLIIDNDDGRPKRLTVKVIKDNRVQVIGNISDNPELMEEKK